MAQVRPIVWRQESISISRMITRQIITRMRDREPEEMCGLLIGPTRGLATMWMPITNVSKLPTRHFEMSPEGQSSAWNWAVSHGMEVCGIVHSHTMSSREATPSKADIEYAAYPHIFYVIASLDPRQLRAYSIDHMRGDVMGNVWEHPVIVDHAKQGLTYCWSHYKYEDAIRCHMICFECGHVFSTERKLVKAHNELLEQFIGAEYARTGVMPTETLVHSSQDVHNCPYCAHSF